MNYRILILEAHPENRELYRRYLTAVNVSDTHDYHSQARSTDSADSLTDGLEEDTQYTVLAADSGTAGLQLCQQQPPDLILLDFQLPDLDSQAFVHPFQGQMGEAPPIIILTEQEDESIAIRHLRAGIDNYLIKGQITADRLRFTVTHTLNCAALRTRLRQSERQQQSALQQQEQDAIELQHNKEIIRQQLAEIEAIYITAPIGLCFIDTDLRFVRINQQLADINGLPIAAHLGHSFREILPELADAVEPIYRHVIESGQPVLDLEVHGTNRAQPGVERDWLASFYPQSDGHDRIIGVNVAVQEITDRKQVEASLRESEERYRYLANSISQLIWIARSDGFILDVNQRWLNYAGMSLEQLQSQGWESVMHPEDVPQLQQRWAVAVTAGVLHEAEGRLRRSDGIYRWHLFQAIPQKNEQGQIVKWYGTATDIHDRMTLQTERERYAARTQILLQKEQSARAAADRANRVKDEFLAVLSHELRSPLNPILGWTKLLQSRKFSSEKMAEALATIERNAQLQAQLIEDLLDISRIMRGKLTLSPTTVKLTQVISAAIETVRLAAEAKHIQIDLQLDPTLTPISGDSGRLQQVIWNLLSNAVKFTPNGGHVEVDLQQVQLEQLQPHSATLQPVASTQAPATLTYAQITVTDTGKGIHPEFLPHVFEYFRQEDSSTSRKYGGLGLGLAIAHQIVEMHGGSISATSAGEGQGSAFTVLLPLQPSALLSEPAPPSFPSNFSLNHLQILLVDDDDDNRAYVGFLLEESGATVIQANSGANALELISRSPTDALPQLIISDIGMPDMDGYTLIQTIRSLPSTAAAIPAIALTAYASEADHEHALKMGFQAHLPKPLDPTLLMSKILSLIPAS